MCIRDRIISALVEETNSLNSENISFAFKFIKLPKEEFTIITLLRDFDLSIMSNDRDHQILNQQLQASRVEQNNKCIETPQEEK